MKSARLLISYSALLLQATLLSSQPQPNWAALARDSTAIVMAVVEDELQVERPADRVRRTRVQPDGIVAQEALRPEQYVVGRLARLRVSQVYKGQNSVTPGALLGVYLPGLGNGHHGELSLEVGSSVLAFLTQPIPLSLLNNNSLSIERTVLRDPEAPLGQEDVFDGSQAFGFVRRTGAYTISTPGSEPAISAALAEIASTQGGTVNRPPTVSVRTQGCQAPCTVWFFAEATDPDDDRLRYSWTGCGPILGPQTICSLSANGVLQATVTVVDSRSGSSTASATFDSRHPSIIASPTTVAFSNVSVGTTQEKPVGITNNGGGTLVGSASVSGSTFSLAGATSYSLGPGQATTITVRFTPAAAGAASGTLTLTGGGGAALPLSGSAISTVAIVPNTATAAPGQSNCKVDASF